MKSFLSVLFMVAAMAAAFPNLVSAHEHYTFEINGVRYEIVIGSLNEPVTVDDKTGVDFRITRMAGMGMEHEHGEGTPVEGLDLKVELQAGGQSKILSLEPAFGAPGAYKAQFYPTVATTLSYRVFGDVEGTPFNYTFTCNPAHPEGSDTEDNERIAVSENVFRVQRSGSYGCPAPKADQGFPEPSASVAELAAATANSKEAAQAARTPGMVGIAVGALGLLVGAGAWMRSKRR